MIETDKVLDDFASYGPLGRKVVEKIEEGADSGDVFELFNSLMDIA